MGLSFALDELHATGWSSLDSSGCAFDVDGRAYPTSARVRQEFAAAGFELVITHQDKFNCYRAEWREVGSEETLAVVGHSEAEAAVYALSQLRRSLVAA
ncbi:MAG: hypothetical protein ACK4WH_03075 [Phycisphaerales bacterium]